MKAVLLIISAALGRFFVLSDLHYDILYDGYYGKSSDCHSLGITGETAEKLEIEDLMKPYCDTSFTLLFETVKKMQEVDSHPDFILILGDSVAHSTKSVRQPDGKINATYNEELIRQSHIDINDIIHSSFPETRIIQTIGNNDASFYYKMPSWGKKQDFLQFHFDLWSKSLDLPLSFLLGGYYSIQLSYNIIVLNSLYFGINSDSILQKSLQMSWLVDTLNKTEGEAVIIMHIPPGTALLNGGWKMWDEYYAYKFRQVVSSYISKIAYIFAGHIHGGLFHMIEHKPIIISPSISPQFGNNPAFRSFSPDINDFTECMLNIYSNDRHWLCRSFSDTFGFKVDYPRLVSELSTGFRDFRDYLVTAVGWSSRVSYPEELLWKVLFGDFCISNEERCKLIGICSIKTAGYYDFLSCLK